MATPGYKRRGRPRKRGKPAPEKTPAQIEAENEVFAVKVVDRMRAEGRPLVSLYRMYFAAARRHAAIVMRAASNPKKWDTAQAERIGRVAGLAVQKLFERPRLGPKKEKAR